MATTPVMMSPQPAKTGNGPESRPSAASRKNSTAKMRPILRPIISDIGTLNIALRAAGQLVAIAAAKSGRATKIPTNGKGFEMAIIPAAPAAAESPIHRPMASASASFAKRENIHEDDHCIDCEPHQCCGHDRADEVQHVFLLFGVSTSFFRK